MSHPTFLKINYRFWWILFFCLQAILIILMAISLIIWPWAYTRNSKNLTNYLWPNDTNNKYNGSSFSGGLFFCKDSCDKDYYALYSHWCDFYYELTDLADTNGLDSSQANPWESVCQMYKGLFESMVLFAALESLSIICVFFWMFSMIAYMKQSNSAYVSFFLAILSLIFHAGAYFGYAWITQVNFFSGCSEFYGDGSAPQMCAGSGPKLAFLVLCILFVVVFWYFVIACILESRHGHSVFKKETSGDDPDKAKLQIVEDSAKNTVKTNKEIEDPVQERINNSLDSQ